MGTPKELKDAARVEGAGDLRIDRSVMVRLAAPAVLALARLCFISHGNDPHWPLIISSNRSMDTLPLSPRAVRANI